MGEIATIIARRGINAGQTSPYATADDFGNVFARNLVNAGGALQDAQQHEDKMAEMEASVNADATTTQARIDWQQKLQDMQNNFFWGSQGFAKQVDREFQSYSNQLLKRPKTLLEMNKVKDGLNHLRSSVFSQSLNFEDNERQGQLKANFNLSNTNDIDYVKNGGNIDVARAAVMNRILAADQTFLSGGEAIQIGYNIDQQLNAAKVLNQARSDPSKALEIIHGNRNTLYDAVKKQESNGNPNAVSGKGAIGLYQIMPATARDVAKRLGITEVAGMDKAQLEEYLKNPQNNERLGKAYLDELLDRYGNNQMLALAAYNGGMKNVDEWIKKNGDPRTGAITQEEFISKIPFGETKDYVQKILANTSGAADPYFSALKGEYLEQTTRQVEQIHHEWQVGRQAEVGQQLRDNAAQIKNGVKPDISKFIGEPELIKIYGPERGQQIAQDERVLYQSADGIRKIQGVTLAQGQEYLDSIKPANNEDGAEEKWEIYNTQAQALQNEQKARAEDPAAVAMRNPDILAMSQDEETYSNPVQMQNYIAKSIIEQQRLGIRDPAVLTKSQVSDFTLRVNTAISKGNTNELLGIFQELPELYGSYYPQVLAELQTSGKLPPAAIGFAAINDAVDAQHLADGIVNGKAYREKLGKTYTPMVEAFDKAMGPLYDTMEIEQQAQIREAGIAIFLSGSGKMSPDQAVTMAAKAFTDKYTINGRVRIDNTRFPAAQVSASIDLMRDNIQLAVKSFDAVGMAGVDQVKDKDLFEAISYSIGMDRVNNMAFVVNEMEDGILVVDQYGQAVTSGKKPVEIKFADMLAAQKAFPVLTEKYNGRAHYGVQLHQAQKDYVKMLFGVK